ncbi:MAG TPA: ABC transporter substrate-binding protein [Dehalococcoidia bacterium]
MAKPAYWHALTSGRISRRRALSGAATVGAGAAALSLVGCGGGGSGSGGSSSSSGKTSLLYTPVESTAKAKPGGTLKDVFAADVPQGFDNLATNNASTLLIAGYTYPRLLKFTVAKAPNAADGTSEGDLASSYEVSPDHSQITFKLRPGLKWDARAPTSNRVIDSSDVAYSWGKFTKLNAAALDLVYDATKSPGSAVESISTPDANTVVFKLKQPDSSIVQLFTSASHFFVQPKESDGGFDPKGTVRGHGPYIIQDYRPSASFTFKKNPDYYVKDRPFFDTIEAPIVTEYATRLAQFKAGNIYTDVLGLLQQDAIQTRQDVPQANMIQDDSFATGVSSFISFGYEGDSIFKDQRLRQAMSMMIDRDAFLDVIANRSDFLKAGYDFPVAYHTIVGAGWQGYWMDPKDAKNFPEGKYLQLNVAEAKKLMSAAGFANGIQFDMYYNGDSNYGPTYSKIADLYIGMFNEVGAKANAKLIPYQQYFDNYYLGYLPSNYDSGKTKGYNGIIYGAEKSYPTVAAQMFATMNSGGAIFHGMTPDGKNAQKGDPKVNNLTVQLKQEFDLQKRQDLAHQLIRYMTDQSYNIPRPGTSKNYHLYWPVIQNLGVFRTYPGGNVQTETVLNWWFDSTKPPAGTS